ncbi:MAG: C-GCAxxG-C-C family protein [Deltaproteobacteria bacterium]|nr:C-GCAxxG-C-C family protein [Deltaproteobacteria bacterium]
MDDDTKQDILELAALGYTCAQIVVIMGLRVMGRENQDLIRSMTGLAMGASSGSLCGALTGGLCLISLYVGKGSDYERPVPGHRIPLSSLVSWFIHQELKGQTSPTCAAIFEAGGSTLDLNTAAPTAACAELVGDTYVKALSLIAEHGLDPTAGREEA